VHSNVWLATDSVGIDSFSIYYSTDGGSTFPYTIAAGEQNDSSYTWLVPDTPSDSCVVKIVAYDSSLNSGEGVSASLFSNCSVELRMKRGFALGSPGLPPRVVLNLNI